ncbi:hypothetical protein [Profundibacterium mesophilum]|uniref:Uncharacterized protein n=1 Tax=Profundibacterium mesophilum KAUST100406-0324 TaxID=1037889 RepID=A0A921NQ17_9RHOB|nr:hypothetical protein [Profundibacterium mesophilum]KAF0676566.1 hypothetical protein PMES_01298 [Profundibacterium mesophilum KAUST100406-0324]
MFAGMFFASLLAATALPDFLAGRAEPEDEDDVVGHLPDPDRTLPGDAAGAEPASAERPGMQPPPWLALQGPLALDPGGAPRLPATLALSPEPGETVIEDFMPGRDRLVLSLSAEAGDFELVDRGDALEEAVPSEQSRLSWREPGGGVTVIFADLDRLPSHSIDMVLVDPKTGEATEPVILAEVMEFAQDAEPSDAGGDPVDDAPAGAAVSAAVPGDMPELAAVSPMPFADAATQPLAAAAGHLPEGGGVHGGAGAQVVALHPRSLPEEGTAPPGTRAVGTHEASPATLHVLPSADEGGEDDMVIVPVGGAVGEPAGAIGPSGAYDVRGVLEPEAPSGPVTDENLDGSAADGSAGEPVLVPVPGADPETFWLTRGGESLAEIHGFLPGEDILRISLDPEQSPGDPTVRVLTAGDAGDALVLVNGEAMAILRGAPSARADDIYVDRSRTLFR